MRQSDTPKKFGEAPDKEPETKQIADQDSDSIYTTNQPQIVEHAKYCVKEYPTIVNNIPKESKHYTNKYECFAQIDNDLANSQRAIGESSNLAQVCLSYGHTFKEDKKYRDYAAILAILAQAAIDSAKRRFDVDIPAEIKRIRQEIGIAENKYPAFWKGIRRDFKEDKINYNITCPMNALYNTRIPYVKKPDLLPMDHFIGDNEGFDCNMKCAKKVIALIDNYSLKLAKVRTDQKNKRYIDVSYKDTDLLLLRNDFDKMVEDIRQISFSNKYYDVVLYLVSQCFANQGDEKVPNWRKNRVILLKTLYKSSPQLLLQIFSNNKGKVEI